MYKVSTVFCSYLSGLNRTYEEAESHVIDLYVTLPEDELEKLINTVQISSSDIQSGTANDDYKYNEATIVAKWNGKEKVFENSSFKTGCAYARSSDKVGYNIKLSKKLLGRKNIRIRPDPSDKSYLRSKLCCDIANRMGLPSVQAVYSRLYVNNEFWGLYTLMDSIKPSWIKQTFNPSAEEVTTLIQCKNGGMNLQLGSEDKCVNANDDYPNMSEFKEFVDYVSSATTTEEIEQVMDVDVFLKFMAMEWLIGSFDHFLVLGHNFYFYKRETDGKWIILEYDYDATFSNGIPAPYYWMGKSGNTKLDYTPMELFNELTSYTFEYWQLDHPIIHTLIINNPERFKQVIHDVLVSAFNPKILNEHIDELKKFILPYVEEDVTPNADGKLPGRVNLKGKPKPSTIKEFETDIETKLKVWVQKKFELACEEYGLDPEKILEESDQFVPKSYDYRSSGKQEEIKLKVAKEVDNKEEIEEEVTKECWSEALGYSCCKEKCKVHAVDKDGKWGVENHQWCGIVDSKCQPNPEAECYGETTKEYPCCTGCKVVLTDKDGDWGYENKSWCSIKYTCK
eukprot:jgi/Orpsp1_1/1188986/evm.model.d7180000068673.1